MIILNRNLTTVDGEIKAGTDVSGILNDAAIADLMELGWADQPGEVSEEEEVLDLDKMEDQDLRNLAKEIGLNLHHNTGRDKLIAAIAEFMNKDEGGDQE